MNQTNLEGLGNKDDSERPWQVEFHPALVSAAEEHRNAASRPSYVLERIVMNHKVVEKRRRVVPQTRRFHGHDSPASHHCDTREYGRERRAGRFECFYEHDAQAVAFCLRVEIEVLKRSKRKGIQFAVLLRGLNYQLPLPRSKNLNCGIQTRLQRLVGSWNNVRHAYLD